MLSALGNAHPSEKAFGVSGTSNLSEHLLLKLARPYGKHILQGCFHAEVERVVFQFLDLIGLMWQKSVSMATLSMLENEMPTVLTQVQILLPLWELDLNRHMLLYLVQAIRANGPVFAWAMFGCERFWKHLIDWMTYKTYPEAVMYNAYHA